MKAESARFEMSAALGNQLPPIHLPEIVFSGKSNVGKSSLINRVLRRNGLARTSNKPGKTATVNFYLLDTLRMVDLPGYGYARVSQAEKMRWSELMQTYFESGRPVALVFQLLDMRHDITADDQTMLDYLAQTGLPFAVVLTKSDKLNVSQKKQRMEYFSNALQGYPTVAVYPFSALSGDGVEEIRRQMIFAAEGKEC